MNFTSITTPKDHDIPEVVVEELLAPLPVCFQALARAEAQPQPQRSPRTQESALALLQARFPVGPQVLRSELAQRRVPLQQLVAHTTSVAPPLPRLGRH